jgi:transaldolase
LKFFIDTANLEEIKEAVSWGLVDGVTTNPTLVSREKGDFLTLIKEIARLVNGPISVEVVSLKADEMVDEARRLSSLAPNIVIKVPLTEEGVVAIHRLHKEKIKTNATLIFSLNQALIAARAGAAYVSPFIGRLDDIGQDGVVEARKMVEVFSHYSLDTEIIAASIRHPQHVQEVALAGVDIATVPFKVLKQMFKHPLTDLGIKKFLADWERIR